MKKLKALLALLLILPLYASAGEVISQGEVVANYPPNMIIIPGTLTCPGGEYVPGPLPGSTSCSDGSNVHLTGGMAQNSVQLYGSEQGYALTYSGLMFKGINVQWNELAEGPFNGNIENFLLNNVPSPLHYLDLSGNYNAKRSMQDGYWLSEVTYKLKGYSSWCDCTVKLVMDVDYILVSAFPMPYDLYNLFFGIPPYYAGAGPDWWLTPEGEGTYVLSFADD
jgi:hypothetical protein